jgi:predicted NUDIX family phosphoesterase
MEFVWVVKRDDLFRGRYPHGFEVLDDLRLAEHAGRVLEDGFFVERRHAERDLTLKQVIPYCVVVSGGRVLRTRRLPRGGEARLHGKRSVGIGGHLNPCDAPDVLAAGLRRELEEELVFDGPWTARAVGLLNDDATDVGAVHVGFVHLVETEAPVRVRETDVLEGELVDVAELVASCRADRGAYETWSAFTIDRMAATPDGVCFVPPGGIAPVLRSGDGAHFFTFSPAGPTDSARDRSGQKVKK